MDVVGCGGKKNVEAEIETLVGDVVGCGGKNVVEAEIETLCNGMMICSNTQRLRLFVGT